MRSRLGSLKMILDLCLQTIKFIKKTKNPVIKWHEPDLQQVLSEFIQKTRMILTNTLGLRCTEKFDRMVKCLANQCLISKFSRSSC